MRSTTYLDEDRFGYNSRPAALDRALEAAQRAVQLAPENQVARHNLAVIRFHRGERDAFLVEEDRAVALNPDNPGILADAGVYFAWLGLWDKGLALVNRALALDPNPPGFYYFPPFFDHYRKGEYEAALAVAQKVNMTDFVWAQALPAAELAILADGPYARLASVGTGAAIVTPSSALRLPWPPLPP